jgi:hypothetical protein
MKRAAASVSVMYSAGNSGWIAGRAQTENIFPNSQYSGRNMNPEMFMADKSTQKIGSAGR